MSETLDTDQSELMFLSGSAITGPKGTVTRTTMGTRTFMRKMVEVQNAPIVTFSEDDPFGENNKSFPNYNDQVAAAFAYDKMVPLSEVSYWLLWGNQMTMSPGEKSFDYPTAEFLRGFLDVILRKYTPKGVEKVVLTPHPVQTVPYQDYVDFMKSTENLDREALMLALDEFVGRYI